MDNTIGWYASLSGMIAALVIAADLGRRATGWAFALFVTSSLAWIAAGLMAQEQALLWQNLVLLGVNVVGVYRWLWRKAPEPARGQRGRGSPRAAGERKSSSP